MARRSEAKILADMEICRKEFVDELAISPSDDVLRRYVRGLLTQQQVIELCASSEEDTDAQIEG